MRDVMNVERDQASAADLLTPYLRDEKTWQDLVEVYNDVDARNVNDPIRALEEIRFLFPDGDTDSLVGTIRMLGFDVHKDLLSTSAESLTKLATQLSRYADASGTIDFVKFIDLLCRSQTEVQYLYSKDYVNFYDEPGGKLLHEGGPWFRTSHVDVAMFMFGLETLQLAGDGETLSQRSRSIFEKFMPSELVIRKFSNGIIIEDEHWLPTWPTKPPIVPPNPPIDPENPPGPKPPPPIIDPSNPPVNPHPDGEATGEGASGGNFAFGVAVKLWVDGHGLEMGDYR